VSAPTNTVEAESRDPWKPLPDNRTPEAKKWPADFIPPQTCGAIDDVQNALEALRDTNSQLRHAAYHWKRHLNRQLSAARARIRVLEDSLDGPSDAVGAAEREVGRYVYKRVSALMNTDPGSAAERELAYLAEIVSDVEEYGADTMDPADIKPSEHFAAPPPIPTGGGEADPFPIEPFSQADGDARNAHLTIPSHRALLDLAIRAMTNAVGRCDSRHERENPVFKYGNDFGAINELNRTLAVIKTALAAPEPQQCGMCGGKGYHAGDPEGAAIEGCDDCNGTGRVPSPATGGVETGEPVGWGLFNPSTGRFRNALFDTREAAEAIAVRRTDNYLVLVAAPLFLASPPPAVGVTLGDVTKVILAQRTPDPRGQSYIVPTELVVPLATAILALFQGAGR
jgi:hypothetical protein